MTLVQASESQSLIFSGFNCIHHCVSFFPGRSSLFFLFFFFFFLFFPQLSLSISSQYSSNSFVHFIEAVFSLPKHCLQTHIFSTQSATVPFLKCFWVLTGWPTEQPSLPPHPSSSFRLFLPLFRSHQTPVHLLLEGSPHYSCSRSLRPLPLCSRVLGPPPQCHPEFSFIPTLHAFWGRMKQGKG